MTTQQTDYVKKGQVQLEKQIFAVSLLTEKQQIILNNSDINEFYFIEDIFKFCLIGTLSFNDRYNLMEFGPFTGNEKIAIVYAVGDKNREIVFDVWKIGKIQQIGTGINEESESIITMHFVDPFFTGFILRRYSRSWSNELYSNIMRDILNNMVFFKEGGLPFNIEESDNKTDFVIPYWTPQVALRWLMRRGKGKQSGTSGYLCFNNTRNGMSHNLMTMNYLLNDELKTIDPVAYSFSKAEVSGENKIIEWWINGIDRTSLGPIRGGVWKGYDFATKKLLNYENTYSDNADKTYCLGKKTLYRQIDDITSSNVVVGDSSNSLLGDISYNDWAKRYNMQFIMNIVVQGHEKRYAGQHIEIDWPSAKRNVGSSNVNALLKGRYLIKSVTHSFSPDSSYPYRQRLVLIKNAYNEIESSYLYKVNKPNIYNDKTKVRIVRK